MILEMKKAILHYMLQNRKQNQKPDLQSILKASIDDKKNEQI